MTYLIGRAVDTSVQGAGVSMRMQGAGQRGLWVGRVPPGEAGSETVRVDVSEAAVGRLHQTLLGQDLSHM